MGFLFLLINQKKKKKRQWMQLFLVFYKLNCCGWWPSLPGPRVEQSVLWAWCLCYVCDALGATAYHHPTSWHVPLQMWLPAVLPNWRWWDKGMEVANKDWREDVTPAALLFIRPGSSSWWARFLVELWDVKQEWGWESLGCGGVSRWGGGDLFWCQDPWRWAVESTLLFWW